MSTAVIKIYFYLHICKLDYKDGTDVPTEIHCISVLVIDQDSFAENSSVVFRLPLPGELVTD